MDVGLWCRKTSPQCCDKHHRRRTISLKSTDKFRIITNPHHSIPTHSLNIPTLSQNPLISCGYILNDTTKEETFFNHSDITQYDAYLPYGELLVDKHSSSEELPYKFNGKQVDEETGLYYYDARYLNPMTSLWYGVDPLTGKYQFIGYVYCIGNLL